MKGIEQTISQLRELDIIFEIKNDNDENLHAMFSAVCMVR
jgi:hypothetical protein